MKNFYLNKFRKAIIFCIAIAFSNSAFCVDLYVSGASIPSAANGRYIPNGTYSGYNSWVHESGGYYIYNDTYGTSGRYWNLDTDFIDEGTAPTVIFYSSAVSTDASPASVPSWSPDTGFSGTLTITEGAPIPEIDIQGNSVSITSGGSTISSNNFTNLGSANISGATIVRTYTIKNVGGATLTLSGSSPYITISGANSSDFSITGIPSASIAANSSTTFQITFNPSASGNRNASISIGNNDANENPYTFAIQGYGFTPSNLVLTGITSPAAANGTYIHQGTIYNFQYWKHQTLNYYIFNDVFSGTSYWNIDVDTDDSDLDYLFAKDSESGSPQGLSGWTANTADPAPTGSPIINDANPTPDISLAGNYIDIINSDVTPSFTDNTNFGSLNTSLGTRTRTFKIHNTGTAVLNLSGSSPYITFGGDAASDFSITTPPSANISTGDSASFVVTFDPTVAGTRIATLSIASNDPDENPYSFTVQGDGFTVKNLIVSGITTPANINGNYIHQGILNEFQYWKHETLNYYIYNHKFSPGTTLYWNIDNDTDDTQSYYYSNNHNEDASPAYVTVWDTSGTNMGAIGTPLIVFAGPEMDVKGNSISIADNDPSPSTSDHTDFGSVAATSGTISRTFTIYNTGQNDLNLSGTPKVAVSGTNAVDFTVTAQPTSPVATLTGSTTFTVSFDPSGIGTRSASLSIANDDSDENPYNFSIQGTGLNNAPVANAPSAPTVIEDDTNVALADDIQVADDDGESQTITFTITGGILSIGTTGITFGGSGNGSASFTASGTLAAINTALDAATFTPTANRFGTNAGTIAFKSNDGTEDSNNATITFDIAAVNDPPSLTATGLSPTFTEGGSASALYSTTAVSVVEAGQTITALTLTITNVNDASSEILLVDGSNVELTNGYTVASTTTNAMAVSVSVTGTTATVSITKGAGISTAATQTLVDALKYSNASDNPNTSNRVLTLIYIKDSGGTANSGDDDAVLSIASTVTVSAVNDRPTLDDTKSPTLTTILEDLANPSNGSTANSTLVTTLVDDGGALDNYFDADGDLPGIAVTAVSQGTLWYTVDGGTNWNSLGAITNTSALILNADESTRVYFKPNANVDGTVTNAITIKAWDRTTGSNGSTGVNTTTGTAFSSTTDNVSVTITGSNDDPTITDLPTDITVLEDVASNIDLSAATFGDVDAGSNSIKLSIKAGTGTISVAASAGLSFTGNASDSITIIGTASNIDAYLNTASNILYTSASNINGNDATTLTLTANDGGYSGTGGGTDVSLGTVNIDITAVNDPPIVGNVFGDNANEVVAGSGAQNITDLDDATVSNVDSPDYDGGFLTITQSVGTSNGSFGVDGTTTNSGGDATIAAGETIAVGGINIGTVHATNDGQGGNSLEITFNSSATSTRIQTLIRSLTYSAPSGLNARTFTLTLDDNDGTTNGGDQDAVGNFVITITPNPPVIDNLDGDNPTIPVGGTSGNIDVGGNATVTDADSPNFNGGFISIVQNTGTSNGNFSVDGITVTAGGDATIAAAESIAVSGTSIGTVTTNGQGGNDLVITFNSTNATPARVQSLLRNIKYAAATGSGDRTFTITITDAAGGSNPASETADITITVIPPEMDLKQGTTSISDGGSYNFGSKTLNSNTDKTFTIHNTSAGVLLISTPITLGGADAGQFGIQLQPSATVAGNDSTTFIIRFTPTSIGSKNATLAITNSDGDENPYNLTLIGDGGTPPTGSNESDTICENQTYTFTSDNFTFDDADDDSFDGIKIITLETAGELKYNNVDVTAGLDCPDVSKLVFIPQLNAHGSPYATFTFKVKDDQGVYSDAVYTMTISVLPEFIAGTLTECQTLCYNIAPVKLIGTAPTGGLAPYTYQWQSSTDGVNFNDIDGETTLEYQPPTLIQTAYYRILQTSSSVCGTIATNIITITVHAEFKVGSISESQAIYYSTKPEKLIGVAPTGGTIPYSYQWQSSENGTDFTDIHGATRLDYQPGSLSNTAYFRLIQSSASGCGTLITNVVSVAVYPEFVVGSISSDQHIVYNTIPEKLIGKEPRGGRHPYSYQWQSSIDGTNFTDIVGATDLDHQPSVLTDTTYYRLIQSSSYDFADKTTNIITIYVYPEFTVGSISEDQTVCYNTAPDLLIGTEPKGGDLPYTYQWQNSTGGVNFTDIAGATNLNYQAPVLTQKTYFRQIQTSASNCGSLITNVVTMTIQAQPIVNIGVDQAMICPNQGYQLSAVAQNYESVTWTSLGDGSFNDVNILSPIYTPGQNDLVNGSVTLVVNAIGISACETLASDQMVLSFYPTPQFNAGNDLTVYENTQQQLNATVSGSHTYTYLWSPAEMVSDPTILNPLTNPITQTTTFTLSVSDIETGCSYQDQITLKVEPGVTYQISGTISSISLKNTLPVTNVFFTEINKTTVTNDLGEYTMQVPAGYSGWAIPSRPGYIFEPDSIAFFNVGEDIVEQDIGGTLFLHAFAYPDSIIAGQSVQLSFEVYGSQNQICCLWMDHYGVTCSSEHNPIVVPTETTLYKVVVEDGFERTYDTVRVYVSTTTGIDDFEVDNRKILMYPNPTKNIVHLEISGELDAQIISVVNPNGTLVRQIKLLKSVNKQKIEINLENLIKGQYYLLITDSKGGLIATKKVIKI